MLGVAEGTQNSHQTKLDADPLTLQRQIDGFQQMTIEGGARAGRVFKYAWYKEHWVDGQMTENKGAAANFIFADLKAGIIGAAISQSDNPDPCSSADFDSAGAIDCSNEFFECVDDQWLIDIVHTDLADGGFPSRFTYGTAKLPAPPADSSAMNTTPRSRSTGQTACRSARYSTWMTVQKIAGIVTVLEIEQQQGWWCGTVAPQPRAVVEIRI